MQPRLSQRAAWSAGQPISDLMAQALAHPHLISLAAGFVAPETLPCLLVKQAAERLFRDEAALRAALQYGTTAGDLQLRELILSHWQARDAGMAPVAHVEQVVLTAGSNQLLHLLVDTLLDPGDLVLTAAPTYLVFLGAVRNAGARAVGIPSDECGPIPEALHQTLSRLQAAGRLGRVKAFYVVPYYNNPCGATISPERRHALLDVVARWSKEQPIYVIADNAYRDLRYEGEDIPSMRCYQDGASRVIETGTFSKTFSPGIRVGWGILPAELVQPVLNQKGNIDFGSPHFAQKLMAQVLQDPGYAGYVEQLRAAYALKRNVMLEAATVHLGRLPGVRWRRPQGGLYLWVELPEEMDAGPEGPIWRAALREGVLYVPGQYCYPCDGCWQGKNTMRLSFGVQTPDGIRRGMEALSRAIRQVQGSRTDA
jgi:2-aminoadipate transaminase